MRHTTIIRSTVTAVLAAAGAAAAAPVVWTGPTTTFTKAGFADWAQPANQDRITDNVWITRKDTQGIFNIRTEAGYTHDFSPAATEWATGSAADWPSLTFQPWELWPNSIPPNTVGVDAVLHLITDDVYLDIRFTDWGIGPAGGGAFSYERSTVPEPGTVGLLTLGAAALLIRRRRRQA